MPYFDQKVLGHVICRCQLNRYLQHHCWHHFPAVAEKVSSRMVQQVQLHPRRRTRRRCAGYDFCPLFCCFWRFWCSAALPSCEYLHEIVGFFYVVDSDSVLHSGGGTRWLGILIIVMVMGRHCWLQRYTGLLQDQGRSFIQTGSNPTQLPTLHSRRTALLFFKTPS
jgi:hypothetical protein